MLLLETFKQCNFFLLTVLTYTAEKEVEIKTGHKIKKVFLENLVLEYDSILSMKHSNEVTNKKKKEIWDFI